MTESMHQLAVMIVLCYEYHQNPDKHLTPPKGWTISYKSPIMLGFTKGRRMVLACRGTAEGRDWKTNFQIARRYLKPHIYTDKPEHITKSIALANDWVEDFNPESVVVTGHSLGANVAMEVWKSLPLAPDKKMLVTFNGYLPFEYFGNPQIIHYRTPRDPVSLLVAKSKNTITVPQKKGRDPHELRSFYQG